VPWIVGAAKLAIFGGKPQSSTLREFTILFRRFSSDVLADEETLGRPFCSYVLLVPRFEPGHRNNRHVTLEGVVARQMDKQIAETQAKTVPNIFSVTDNCVWKSKEPVLKLNEKALK